MTVGDDLTIKLLDDIKKIDIIKVANSICTKLHEDEEKDEEKENF